MKTIATMAVWLLAVAQGPAQQAYPAPADLQTFYMYFLNTGPNSGKGTPEERKEIQAQHMAHLNSLGDADKIGGPFVNGGEREGKLHLAGPLSVGGAHRGIGVMATEDVEEARRWMADDPLVKAGYLVMVPLQWFAADGILLRK